MTSPAAATRHPPVPRPPVSAGSRPGSGRSQTPNGRSQASHRPLQLELFGGGRAAPSKPPLRPPPARNPGRPSDSRHPHVPHRPHGQATLPSGSPQGGRPTAGLSADAAHAGLFRRLSRLIGGRLRSLLLTDNRRTILSVRPVAPAEAANPAHRRRTVPRIAAQPAARRPLRGRLPERGPGPPIDLRIHRSFAIAPEPVLRAVAAFLGSSKGSPSARRSLVAIREHFHLHRPDPRALPSAGSAATTRLSLCPVGEGLDLRPVAADPNQRYYDGRLP